MPFKILSGPVWTANHPGCTSFSRWDVFPNPWLHRWPDVQASPRGSIQAEQSIAWAVNHV
ncbi:hypothetical protein SERLA73DRAFT_143370, partial [Serpula lacrymans var. lacrymans S7.3]